MVGILSIFWEYFRPFILCMYVFMMFSKALFSLGLKNSQVHPEVGWPGKEGGPGDSKESSWVWDVPQLTSINGFGYSHCNSESGSLESSRNESLLGGLKVGKSGKFRTIFALDVVLESRLGIWVIKILPWHLFDCFLDFLCVSISACVVLYYFCFLILFIIIIRKGKGKGTYSNN